MERTVAEVWSVLALEVWKGVRAVGWEEFVSG